MFGIGRCFGLGGGNFGGYGPGVYGAGGTNWIIPLAMGAFRLLLLAIIIYFVYRLFSRNKRNNNVHVSTSSAMGILDDRFARGEISEEEYNAKKRQLQM